MTMLSFSHDNRDYRAWTHNKKIMSKATIADVTIYDDQEEIIGEHKEVYFRQGETFKILESLLTTSLHQADPTAL